MKKFDYFSSSLSDGKQPPESTPAVDTDSVEAPRTIPWRQLATLTIALTFFWVTAWFMASYIDVAKYALGAPCEPLNLGDVTELTPDQIPHNAYVTIHGITEHRGLRQQLMRELNFSLDDFWYFRLLGSRGVFIETPPNSQKYGFTTEVTVSGRAVDPTRSRVYANLVQSYSETFNSENRADLRIIQVGLRPGEHRAPYWIAGIALTGLALANVVVAVRLIRDVLKRESL